MARVRDPVGALGTVDFTSMRTRVSLDGARARFRPSSYALGDGRTLAADLHAFRVAAADGLDTGRIGEELDLTYRWTYAPGVALTGGLSYFLVADAGPLGPADNQVWGYVMVDVTF